VADIRADSGRRRRTCRVRRARL